MDQAEIEKTKEQVSEIIRTNMPTFIGQTRDLKKVSLLMHDNFLGVVRPCESGVVFSNQAGGTACAQPEIEGIFLPLPLWAFKKDQDTLEDHWGDTKHEPRVQALQNFLIGQPDLISWFRTPTVLELEVARQVGLVSWWGEAWVPLIILPSVSESFADVRDLLEPFIGELVFLTNPNSD